MINVLHGDCCEIMPTLEAESFDAIVCDPPYHLTSIVKRFGGKNAAPAQHGTDGAFARASRGFMSKVWDGGDVAFRVKTWETALRVLKPGGYILAFSSSRTFGRMSVAIEDAGFITHPMIGWIFATGFPKATRLKAPDTDHLRYGAQALKPALEPIYMGQKPMEGTGTENWLAHGTGALNISACRIEAQGRPLREKNFGDSDVDGQSVYGSGISGASRAVGETDLGRWPANLCHDGSPQVLEAFAAFGERGGGFGARGGKRNLSYGFGGTGETVGFGDSGSPARFFFSAKANSEDRLGSKHPTVKPLDLMAWLLRLVVPPGGHVLDPFAGSGSTGMAAMREGFDATLIELEEESVKDIHNRLAHVHGHDTPLFADKEEPALAMPDLFDGAA